MDKNDEQKYTTLPGKFHIQDCHFSSQMLLIRFNFQNNHGNANSGKNRTRFFKVVRNIGTTLFSEAVTKAVL